MPLPTTAPDFISFCQTYAPSSARFAPSRSSTYGASDVQWIPCIAAITPSLPKRGMSAALRCCACSMRHRRSFLLGMRLERLFEDVQRLAVGAVADRVHAELVPVLDGELRGLADIGGIVRVQAAAVRLIGVRLEQPRAARARARRRSARLMARTVK